MSYVLTPSPFIVIINNYELYGRPKDWEVYFYACSDLVIKRVGFQVVTEQ
jgi:hypothetical protein